MPLHEARWWEQVSAGKLRCDLCPKHCVLFEGQRGYCGVRLAKGGKLWTEVYGKTGGLAVDPIEKKPLYHFLPGSRSLSFGTCGCNMGCSFCQNWPMSQERKPKQLPFRIKPRDVVRLALEEHCSTVSFTYNEPIISGEFCIDVAAACHEEGLRTVAVSNGYVASEARRDVFSAMDAANVDLKGFSEDFYHRYCVAQLAPVLETLDFLAQEKRTWLELTTLLIPGANDDEDELKRLCAWVLDHLGPEVPLHFSAFHPDYRLLDSAPTSFATLHAAREIARAAGLRYVYTGNVRDREGSTTYCPACGKALIERDGFHVLANHVQDGRCECGVSIAGVFSEAPKLASA